ncbi:NAD(P)-binding protein [Rhodotorula sp. JG-1b]|nr:NAD(P)-binding protein [Rhodotorula sp. JG-1b]
MPVVSLSPFSWAEGLTIDVLIRLLNKTFLDPASHWVVLVSYAVQSVTRSSVRRLSFLEATKAAVFATPTLARSDPFFQAILALCAVGTVLKLDKLLDRLARNNFTTDKQGWKWGQPDGGEIVLTTILCPDFAGAGGLGSNVACRLAARKIKVVVLDVAPLAADAPESIAYYKVDLSNAEEIRQVAEKVRREIGHPSVLVNMAGVVKASSILDMAQRDIDLTYDINVKAHYYTVQAFLPHMLEEGHGHVVTIASSTAYHQAANGVAYCSSKAAALSFHEGLTEELRHLYLPHSKARAVRTSVICPAHFKSGMFAGFVSGIPEFLAPSLEVDTVAELVEKTILSGESQHIIEPYYASFTPLGRALPTWIYGGILACAKDAMGHVQTARGGGKSTARPNGAKSD